MELANKVVCHVSFRTSVLTPQGSCIHDLLSLWVNIDTWGGSDKVPGTSWADEREASPPPSVSGQSTEAYVTSVFRVTVIFVMSRVLAFISRCLRVLMSVLKVKLSIYN